jgi:sulfite reductase (NADPH) flavoprotein alpha-component
MLAPMIPDNAPFSPEQRAWLNGFFAGLLSLDGSPALSAAAPALGAVPAIGAFPAAATDPLADGDDGEAPWHDPTIPLVERMKLAKTRPLRRRLMAAMAQQDCGQCGYNCEEYANALFLRNEKRLNLCVPGGKETQRMLKALYAEMDDAAAGKPANDKAVAASAQTVAAAAPASTLGYSRETPAMVAFLGAMLLNKGSSEKETRHIEFDTSGSGLDYRVGDSLGVFVSNPPQLVDAVVAALDVSPDAEVGDGNGHSRGLREALLDERALGTAPDALFELLAGLADDTKVKAKLELLAQGEDPDGDLDSLDVLAVLEKFSSLKPSPKDLIEALDPLQPRLYSISSSPKAKPGRLHLTVDTVRYRIGDRQRLGVASTFLADRIRPGETLPAYIQRSHGFALPADPATPIVMVGPGTGVAPFRAFLHERRAIGAAGKAWLFFGHQRRTCDFFYEDEFTAMLPAGTLTRLSLAFSRDQAEKIYVQDRMREEGDELFRWLEEGAHLFVCGDARRMAPDVERTLIEVVARHGGKNEKEAKAYVAALGKTGRYRKDVY